MMDTEAKKRVLRMIPYGLYVLTAATEDGQQAAGTVNWVTQASFKPPLVVAAIKADSTLHEVTKQASAFALNVLGKGQQSLAFTFFKPVDWQDDSVSGQPYHRGETGSPILDDCIGYCECRVVAAVEEGDHTVFVAEVVAVGEKGSLEGRADEATLWLRDLGENIFYGG